MEEWHRQSRFGSIVGASLKMQEVYNFIAEISKKKINVLIAGETGTGKELVAREIHAHSFRKDKPFISINCAGIPGGLLESELFGHEMGAFTGATRMRRGAFELAEGGTLFLDEVGDMSLETQSKILRAIEGHGFTRVGGEELIETNIRLIAATNKDLVKEILAGRFRKDLYYRLNVAYIYIPPLRERREDIPLLVEHFIEEFNHKCGSSVRGISPEALNLLMKYNFDGNVRELRNFIERIVSSHKVDFIRPEHLSQYLIGSPAPELSPEHTLDEWVDNLELDRFEGRLFESVEEKLIRSVLRKTNFNKTKAAKILGVALNTLKKKMRTYGITSS
jgi:transcriptional regulator with PAS, ATPase and Fis domain